MSAPDIILDCLPSFCQKLLDLVDLVEVRRSYNKTILLVILESQCSPRGNCLASRQNNANTETMK